jgi:hypothetical protein
VPPSKSTVWAVAALLILAAALLAFTILRPRSGGPDAGRFRPVERGANVATIAAAPHLLFARSAGIEQGSAIELAALSDPSGPRATTALQCSRISFADNRGICLQTHLGIVTSYEAVFFDAQFQPQGTLKLQGAPTRTRVSPDGRYGAITVFVTGQQHGYNSVSFSTRTSIVDMATARELTDLEQFAAARDGQPFAAKDFNFWGVTFARDSNVFYATLMTNGKRYLVRGDIAHRSITVLHENVECPALSPDNRLLAYKKRVGGDLAPWRFYVLDLATMTERPIAGEARSIDDQVEWLDDGHVLYSTARSSQSPVGDVWVAAVLGAEAARPLVSEAQSPIVVR